MYYSASSSSRTVWGKNGGGTPLSLWWPALPPLPYSTVSISITILRCLWFVVVLIGAVFPHSSLLVALSVSLCITSSVHSRTLPMTGSAHSTETRWSTYIAPLSPLGSWHTPTNPVTLLESAACTSILRGTHYLYRICLSVWHVKASTCDTSHGLFLAYILVYDSACRLQRRNLTKMVAIAARPHWRVHIYTRRKYQSPIWWSTCSSFGAHECLIHLLCLI